MKITPQTHNVVYISGPMRGYPDLNRAAFEAKTKELQLLGFTVINPFDLARGVEGCTDSPTDEDYLAADIRALTSFSRPVNALVLLPDWHESRFANIEVFIANTFGITCATAQLEVINACPYYWLNDGYKPAAAIGQERFTPYKWRETATSDNQRLTFELDELSHALLYTTSELTGKDITRISIGREDGYLHVQAFTEGEIEEKAAELVSKIVEVMTPEWVVSVGEGEDLISDDWIGIPTSLNIGQLYNLSKRYRDRHGNAARISLFADDLEEDLIEQAAAIGPVEVSGNAIALLQESTPAVDALSYVQPGEVVVFAPRFPSIVPPLTWPPIYEPSAVQPLNGQLWSTTNARSTSLTRGELQRVIEGLTSKQNALIEIRDPYADLTDADVFDPAPAETESCLSRAHGLIHGPRNESYGHPFDDFSRTGVMWGAIIGDHAGNEPITPEKVGLMMTALKISRECNKPGQDNIDDAAGYIGCVERIKNRREGLE